MIIATAAVGGFAVVVGYSYDKGQMAARNAAVPIITAQQGPTKMRPKEPGGMVVPDQDKQVYGRLNVAEKPKRIERLLPPPETVVSRPPPLPAPADPSTELAMNQQETEKVAKELSAIEPAAGNPNRPIPAPPVVHNEPVLSADKPKEAAKPVEEARLTAPTKPAAMPDRSAFRIQLASVRSRKAAEQAWERYKFDHAELFGKLESDIVRVDLKGKGTFYRLQVGPLADASAARSLCGEAKKKKIGCIIVRP